MTDLQEVRRYWPRAVTMVSGEWYTAAGLKADLYRIGQVWQVTITTPGDAYRRHCQPTIAEAMRAAGFGGRPQYAMKGYHFAAANRSAAEVRMIMRNWRAGTGRAPAPIERWVESLYRLPALVSTQRPRKGARLGRRKREALRRIEEPEDCSSVTKYGATGAARGVPVRQV